MWLLPTLMALHLSLGVNALGSSKGNWFNSPLKGNYHQTKTEILLFAMALDPRAESLGLCVHVRRHSAAVELGENVLTPLENNSYNSSVPRVNIIPEEDWNVIAFAADKETLCLLNWTKEKTANCDGVTERIEWITDCLIEFGYTSLLTSFLQVIIFQFKRFWSTFII